MAVHNQVEVVHGHEVDIHKVENMVHVDDKDLENEDLREDLQGMGIRIQEEEVHPVVDVDNVLHDPHDSHVHSLHVLVVAV